MAFLLCLLFGVLALLSFLEGVSGVSFTWWIVYPWPILAGAFLWACYYRTKKRRYFAAGTGILAALCMVYVFCFFDTIKEQGTVLLRRLSGGAAGETADITVLALILGVILTLLFFMLELVIRNHWILYILTTVLLILTPLLGVRLTVFDLALLFLFQFSFWGFFRKESRDRGSVHGRLPAIMWAALPVMFVLAVAVAYNFQDTVYQMANEVEGTITRAADRRTGQGSQMASGGKVSRGNAYPNGTERLVVTASGQPAKTLYLRGFEGGAYTGGSWTSSFDEELFYDMLDTLEWTSGFSGISDRYDQMYYTMNLESGGADEFRAIQIRIRNSSNSYNETYVPYYSLRYPESYKKQPGGAEAGYTFYLFEQKDMDIEWDNVPADFEEERDKYAELQDVYMDEIRTAYTQVPEEKLPRLVQLVKAYPLTEINDITSFILYTLSTCTYSLTPGWAPLNEDIVEYFLFDNREGFCEQFAAAATLMYRLYGVPARYASGYRALPDAFAWTDEDGWEARLTDEDAHAWVEIFLPDYGWTPVEVTPSTDGVTEAVYPGFDRTEYEKIRSKYRWDQNTWRNLSGSDGFESGREGGQEERDFLPDISLDQGQRLDIGMTFLVCLVYGLLFLPLVLDERRRRLLKRQRGGSPRATYDRLIRMMHFCGVLQTYTGDEPDFSSRLLAEIPGVTPDEWSQFYSMISRMAYGPGETSGAEDMAERAKEETAREIYQKIAKELSARLGWWKRQIFIYIKVYGWQ